MDFILRPFLLQDVDDIAQAADNPRIAAFLRDVFPCPYTRADAAAYIESCLHGDPRTQLCRAIDIDGHAVGSIGLFVKDDVYCRSAELGYWLAEPYWGRHIMRRAVGQLCREGFAAFDIERIFAEPYAHNAGSRKVLESAGFTLEGTLRRSVYKNGHLYDSCIYALLRERSADDKQGD